MTSPDMKGVSGLTNIGNTCYGNATIQAIRHQIDLTCYLLQEKHKDIISKKKRTHNTQLLEGYSDLIHKMWSGQGGISDTRPMWSAMLPAAIQNGYEQFRMAQQHDADEFLTFLLDGFHEALAEDVSMTITSKSDNSDVKNALSFWKQTFEKSYSPLVELVFNLLRKSVVCSKCKKESVTWETMNMKKVSVPKSSEPVELLKLMEDEGKDDPIENFACATCGGTEDVTKRTKADVFRTYWRLGNWVIVVLKRYDNMMRKVNTKVNIPKETTFSSLFHPNTQEPSATSSYELFSTIDHHGPYGGGHYTAYAKHPVSGAWNFYDDGNASQVEDVELSNSSYILMYRKKVPAFAIANPSAKAMEQKTVFP